MALSDDLIIEDADNLVSGVLLYDAEYGVDDRFRPLQELEEIALDVHHRPSNASVAVFRAAMFQKRFQFRLSPRYERTTEIRFGNEMVIHRV